MANLKDNRESVDSNFYIDQYKASLSAERKIEKEGVHLLKSSKIVEHSVMGDTYEHVVADAGSQTRPVGMEGRAYQHESDTLKVLSRFAVSSEPAYDFSSQARPATIKEYTLYFERAFPDREWTFGDYTDSSDLKAFAESCNNIMISPALIKKMIANPAFAEKTEKAINDQICVDRDVGQMFEQIKIPDNPSFSSRLSAHGTIFNADGTMTSWAQTACCVSKKKESDLLGGSDVLDSLNLNSEKHIIESCGSGTLHVLKENINKIKHILK